MIKLTEILQDILAEKKLCPKGKAYYNRRKAAGEKPSAYLSGRAVKVCKGLMEEGEYDDSSKFDLVKQNPLDIKKLVNKGIIFITKPGNGQGGVEEPNWEGDASVITLYNMANAEPWMEEAVKTPLPQAIPHIQNDQDNLLYDGKYNQILWGIKKKGLKPEDFYLNVNESLRDWFKKEDWVRIDTAGNITGPCGTMKKGNKTTRCLPRAKANSLTKAERAATSKKKAASDKQFVPNTDKAKVKLKEGLEDTSWTNDKDQTITLQQLLDAIKDYPVVQAPIEKIEKIIIRKDTGGIESDRLSAADVKYPIIIVTDDSGNYKYILDGNHRANKAIDAELESIPAKLVNISKLPQEFQDVLNEIDEYDVENEQDLKEFVTFIKEYKQVLSEGCECLTEAEYRGRKVQLGKIMQGDIKKFKVYVKNNKGKVVKVNFGFGGKSAKGKRMVIKAKNPKRRAAYRARHNCDNPGPRWKANYWSCKKW